MKVFNLVLALICFLLFTACPKNGPGRGGGTTGDDNGGNNFDPEQEYVVFYSDARATQAVYSQLFDAQLNGQPFPLTNADHPSPKCFALAKEELKNFTLIKKGNVAVDQPYLFNGETTTEKSDLYKITTVDNNRPPTYGISAAAGSAVLESMSLHNANVETLGQDQSGSQDFNDRLFCSKADQDAYIEKYELDSEKPLEYKIYSFTKEGSGKIKEFGTSCLCSAKASAFCEDHKPVKPDPCPANPEDEGGATTGRPAAS